MGGTPGSFSTAQPAAPANLIPAGQSTIGGADPSMLSNQPMGGGAPQGFTPGPAGPPGAGRPAAQPISQQSFQRSRPSGTNTPPTPGFSPYLRQQRSKFAQEINSNPNMRPALGAMMALENAADPIGPIESLMNRAAMTGQPLSQMLSPSFYGPMRTGAWQRAYNQLRNNPQAMARYNAVIDQVLNGSNVLGGATDQGSGDDPNAGWSGGRVRRSGEVYNDWGGYRGHGHAAQWREAQQRRVQAEQPPQRSRQLAATQQNPGWSY
jgi:hypothetical protein